MMQPNPARGAPENVAEGHGSRQGRGSEVSRGGATPLGGGRAEEPQSGELDRQSVPQQHVLRRQDRSPRAQGDGSVAVLGGAPWRNAFQGAAVSGRVAK